jgi:hypothetical protein
MYTHYAHYRRSKIFFKKKRKTKPYNLRPCVKDRSEKLGIVAIAQALCNACYFADL